MYFWTYGLRKTWLDKCLRSPVPEDLSRNNIINRPQNCWNLNDSTFTIFIDHWEDNYDWKSVTEWCAKSLDCLLIQWHPMTCILFLTEAIYWNVFRFFYLRKEKYFLKFVFFLDFLNLDSILNFWIFEFLNFCSCIFELTDSEKRG